MYTSSPPSCAYGPYTVICTDEDEGMHFSAAVDVPEELENGLLRQNELLVQRDNGDTQETNQVRTVHPGDEDQHCQRVSGEDR
jgi:hypothetical protein